MKLLVLLFLATTVLGAQELAFPHQPHIAQGLDCLVCHSEATASSTSEDLLLPDAMLCQSCHNDQIAPQIDASAILGKQPVSRSFRFDHQQHLGLGNIAPRIAKAIDEDNYFGHPGDLRRFLDSKNACAACHRGMEESTVTGLKIHLPQMADCIVCHTEIDNPFTCTDCHSDNAVLMPVDHSREFVDLHSTGRVELDKISCLPCHGKNFSCMGCH